MIEIYSRPDITTLTAHEQFAIDSMSVISDDELMGMRLWSIDSVLRFAEMNGRQRNMELLDKAAARAFSERAAKREQKEEEERLRRQMELEMFRREERNRRRRERRRILKMQRLAQMERQREREEKERLKAYIEAERLRLEENIRKQNQQVDVDTYPKHEPEPQEISESKPRKELGFFSRCILALKSLRGFPALH